MYTLVSPWPPTRNGIADYAYAIAEYTAHPLTVITRTLDPKLPPRAPVRVVSDFDPAAAQALQDGRNIFHFGNNPDHVFAVPLFLNFGGVAVVHDATLHFLCECADAVMPGFFDAMLLDEQPQTAAQLARIWREPGFKRVIDYQETKLLSWLQGAKSIVVHSRYAARVVGCRLPGIPTHVIPHFAYQPHASFAQIARLRAVARQRLKLPEDALIVSTVGFVTRNKQYDAIIQAIRQLPAADRGRVRFIVAGAIRPHEFDLAELINVLGAGSFVDCMGFVDESQMRDVLLASDLICNLRYPTFGESSGSLARALGLGCGIVLSRTGSYAEFPDEICFHIAAKPDPSAELTVLLQHVLADRTRLVDKQRAAYDYARTVLDPNRAAALYQQAAYA